MTSCSYIRIFSVDHQIPIIAHPQRDKPLDSNPMYVFII